MKPKKILIVEDSKLLHNMYRMMLRKYECTLIFALNGREGLDQLAGETDVDLIILDINMPVMTGIEFLQEVKKNEAYAQIPVVIISTEGKEADVERGMQLGAMGYITKPFQSPGLDDLIEKVFSN